MRSWALACLVGLSSCLVRVLYSSIVREKAVREAEIVPSVDGFRDWDCGWWC